MQFRGRYWFLSNMYSCPVRLEIGGTEYRFQSAEAAFQAGKCPGSASAFTGINGFEAKKLGCRVTIRPDWDGAKLAHMEAVLRAKFSQNPELARQLAAVEGPIVEDNKWGDKYWGMYNGFGQNHLGKLLMKLRDELAGN